MEFNEDELFEDLLKLKLIRDHVIKALINTDSINVEENEWLDAYRNFKAEVLLKITKPAKIPLIENKELRKALRSLLKDDEIIREKLKESGVELSKLKNYTKLFRAEFDEHRKLEVAEEVYLPWFSYLDYVDGLISTHIVVIKYQELPEKLHALVEELRQCLIFQNYLAAGIMLRTIIEVAIDDIFQRFDNIDIYDWPLFKKIKFLSEKTEVSIPASILNKYRRELNEFVHGKRLPDQRYIEKRCEVVLSQVEEIYEKI